MSNPRVPAIFQAFLNQKVEVTEEKRTVKCGRHPAHTYDVYRVASTDRTIKSLQAVVAERGMRLRVLLPGMMGTDDFGPDRLNVYLNKRNDGWKITGLDIG